MTKFDDDEDPGSGEGRATSKLLDFVTIVLVLEILKLFQNRIRYIFAADGSYVFHQ